MYRDIESNEIVTTAQLKQEYERAIKDGIIYKEEQTFEHYVENCMTRNNGTLERI